jgi:hypothetical protein
MLYRRYSTLVSTDFFNTVRCYVSWPYGQDTLIRDTFLFGTVWWLQESHGLRSYIAVKPA